MSDIVAVLVGKDGETVSFLEKGVVRLYRRETEGWQLIRELPYSAEPDKGMKHMRDLLHRLVELIDGAKAVVGREVAGISFNVFDSAGLSIIEAPGKPLDFLERVWEILNSEEGEEEGMSDTESAEDIPESPVPDGKEGRFYLDLKKLQLHKPEITSKKALLPFLKNETFYELVVICAHVPPWFDRQFGDMGLKYNFAKKGEDEVCVTIYHDVCRD
ncbi:Fe-only nitrogenase accessory protein AnfO [Anaerobacterium chartisolvens]|uniref:Fe-only nitrogenase accessory protein AnfO n=1 Tax=Anaerobacterium chartisolvens TaxID=1297424 RepID=A0A369AYY9_9FIRM|nr:Fe-only nitrogenase accessory protein AnfO [Anaerobacterium chartisolvens]RCX14295.1 Fe-only nitrogenase accessory protein AnfO [Anaerobacterium chartisolvens]